MDIKNKEWDNKETYLEIAYDTDIKTLSETFRFNTSDRCEQSSFNPTFEQIIEIRDYLNEIIKNVDKKGE